MEQIGATWGGLAADSPRGILPSQYIRELLNTGVIRSSAPLNDTSIQPSSIDLRLGKKGWRVPAAFMTRNGTRIADRLAEFENTYYTLDLTKPTFLEARKMYVFELQEEVTFPKHIRARSNPKSSTGRADTFARLIVDGSRNFDFIPDGYSGKLYLLVYPISFDIIVKEGLALNQIRMHSHNPPKLSTEQLFAIYERHQILYDKEGRPIPPSEHIVHDGGLHLSIDLSEPIVGYKSRKNSPPLNLLRSGHHEVHDYWEPIKRPSTGRLILDPEHFYIFKSKELIRIPTPYAAEVIDFHSGIGEFRSHYAGFFDPGFGYGKHGELKGAAAVFEARVRDTPMEVEDGQLFCKFTFEKMAAVPEIAYGVDIKSHYQGQGLRLGKHFKS
ncbi:2'-deoxycytidine 5'-triphosphate deaminase [Candidatus Woesearchaeota archaeon]|nr:2'-deoxycytidine 5'-triphosphate deaminase [Candidatus Woesearchaeota archaeon]